MKDLLHDRLYKIGLIKIRQITLNKNQLLCCIHIMVSIFILTSIFVGVFLIYAVSDELRKNDFLKHGLDHAPYLFSVWVLVCQQISLNTYTVLDIIDIFSIKISKEKKDYLHSVASYFLYSTAFPLSLTVGIVFWSLYFHNKEALYPKIVEHLLPPTLNHIGHTLPPLLTLFYVVSSSRFIPSKSSTRLGLFVFLTVYGLLLMYIKMVYGKWIYLAFEALTPPQMKFLLFFSFVASFAFLELGYAINDIANSLSNRGIFKVFDAGLHIWIPTL